MLSQERFELAPVLPARVAVWTVDSAPVPGQPPTRLGVDILAMAQVEQLPLECHLRFGIGPPPTEFASEHDVNGHAHHLGA